LIDVQLLGLIGPGKKAGQSAAVMDLGGASTQIVFEPAFPSTSKLSPGDHVYDLSFASEDHTLYQHSHLGYGLMQARRSVHNLVAFTHVWLSTTKGGSTHKEWEDLTENDLIHTPCLVKGGKKTVLLDPPGRKAVNVTLLGTGAGFDACRRIVDVVMAKDALCETEPCAFGGVYQPKLMETFGTGPIYALSYFYDRIVPLGLGKDGKPFTIADLRDLTNDVCAGPNPSGSSTTSTTSSAIKGWSRFGGNLEAMEELKDRPEYCLDLSFMYSLLSLGYELAPERELVTGKKINDIELGW
jgi:guanosine-diphosphatase